MIRLGFPIHMLPRENPFMSDNQTSEGPLPSWQDLEEFGASDRVPRGWRLRGDGASRKRLRVDRRQLPQFTLTGALDVLSL